MMIKTHKVWFGLAWLGLVLFGIVLFCLVLVLVLVWFGLFTLCW